MHRRIGIGLVALALLIAGASGAVAGDHQATVTFENQTSGGTTVTVDSVTLPNGGFVAIHDSTLADGAVLSSVRGTSAYLEAGTHENVTVTLDEPISEDATLIAMPHKDTDGDRIYEFVASSGGADGPYTVDGNIVMTSAEVTASATVSYETQPTKGGSLVVDRVELAKGGFVTIHDATVTEGAVFDSVRGTSAYLSAGVHENVRVTLDEPLSSSATVVPMAHLDTNDNEQYDFLTSEGEADGPYTDMNGDIVLTTGKAKIMNTASATFANQTSGGHYVEVESVFLPEGGFVTAHDGSLADGAVFDSVRGTSAYLGAGYHENVGIVLDEPLDSQTTIIAMPHKDTNDNEQYDFVTSEGEADGPYTDSMGNIVVDSGTVTIGATVAIDDQASNGNTVVVERADLPEDGFVTIHDASLTAGAVFDSVRGSSPYLESGLSENVEITLDEPLTTTTQVYAMPHRDSNDNRVYDFVTSEGGADGPFTSMGNIVLDPATVTVTAQVTIADQMSDGETVTIERTTLHNGGFITIHDASLADGAVFDSVRGSSAYLAPGTHENVEITLDTPYETNGTAVAMPHLDTNGNERYDFVTSEGAADGPYTAGDTIVTDAASIGLPARADVTFESQATAGASLTVAEVSMTRGGFVTIHDASLTEGAVFDSVRGTSDYLAPGTHENVTVELKNDERIEESGTFIAMPHMDTNDNERYDFVRSDGANDGPFTTAGGDIVVAPAEVTLRQASVSIMDQTSSGETVRVASASLSQGGFITIHDASLQDGAVFDSVRGSSAYLEAGSHSDVEVTLDDPLEESGTVIAMPHLDTNGNEQYDFVASEGANDGPYTTAGGDIVVDAGAITVEQTEMTEMDDATPTEGNGPGFGVAAAIVALAGAALLARRR